MSILALDYGEKRIGVAVASQAARLPHPLATLPNDAEFFTNLKSLCAEHEVKTIVVGLPRGLSGQATRQTESAEAFAGKIKTHLGLPVHLQDEALSSVRAETELSGRKSSYQKSDVDALAAAYILEDFLQATQEMG